MTYTDSLEKTENIVFLIKLAASPREKNHVSFLSVLSGFSEIKNLSQEKQFEYIIAISFLNFIYSFENKHSTHNVINRQKKQTLEDFGKMFGKTIFALSFMTFTLKVSKLKNVWTKKLELSFKLFSERCRNSVQLHFCWKWINWFDQSNGANPHHHTWKHDIV